MQSILFISFLSWYQTSRLKSEKCENLFLYFVQHNHFRLDVSCVPNFSAISEAKTDDFDLLRGDKSIVNFPLDVYETLPILVKIDSLSPLYFRTKAFEKSNELQRN
jgi:hypothetical protein